MKNVPLPVAPHFVPASLNFHLNRPVISLIQLHIASPSWNCGPHCPPISLVPEPPLAETTDKWAGRVSASENWGSGDTSNPPWDGKDPVLPRDARSAKRGIAILSCPSVGP